MDQELIKKLESKDYAEIIDSHTVVYKGENVVEAMAHRCGIDYTWPGK